MTDTYFSDKVRGPRPRIEEEISDDAWGGIVSLIQDLVRSDAFAERFTRECPDKGRLPSGTDRRDLCIAIRAEIPELDWPLDLVDLAWYLDSTQKPSTLDILDFIQFCHRNVTKAVRGEFHDWYGPHYHLSFDREQGRTDFRRNIERIFARNGLAYELQEDGQIIRLAPPVLRERLQSTMFQTGDNHLDSMLEAARAKYLNPNPLVRRESLEKLWDAWERLKTLENPADKKNSVGILLDKASTEVNFRDRLERESKELTEIGNNFMIRHTETGKTPITSNEQVDYLFQRLFALIYLLLESR